MGNPIHPILYPDIHYPVYKLPNKYSFLERLYNVVSTTLQLTSYYWHYMPRSDKVARKYFGENMPYLGDIAKEYCSLVLTNVNFLTNPIRPNVPNVIEIDQVLTSIKTIRPIPKVSDINKI